MKKVSKNYISYFNEQGERHREDGPAVEYNDGGKEWWVNGKLHREDGPAVEHKSGYDKYYFNDINYSFERWQQIVKLKAFI